MCTHRHRSPGSHLPSAPASTHLRIQHPTGPTAACSPISAHAARPHTTSRCSHPHPKQSLPTHGLSHPLFTPRGSCHHCQMYSSVSRGIWLSWSSCLEGVALSPAPQPTAVSTGLPSRFIALAFLITQWSSARFSGSRIFTRLLRDRCQETLLSPHAFVAASKGCQDVGPAPWGRRSYRATYRLLFLALGGELLLDSLRVGGQRVWQTSAVLPCSSCTLTAWACSCSSKSLEQHTPSEPRPQPIQSTTVLAPTKEGLQGIRAPHHGRDTLEERGRWSLIDINTAGEGTSPP